MSLGLRLGCVVLGASLWAGCEQSEDRTSPLAVADSGGLTIVRAPGDTADNWTVRDKPLVVIGPDDGAETGPLFGITDGERLADGRFVIASAGSDEVRFYSPSGRLDRVVGRSGRGPREFGYPDIVRQVSDSVWVYDAGNRRIAVLDLYGTEFGPFIGSGLGVDRAGRLTGILSTGAVLVRSSTNSFPEEAGPREVIEELSIRTPEGEVHDAGAFFTFQSHWVPEGEGLLDVGSPFDFRGHFAAGTESWFYTDSRRYRIEQYGIEGERLGVLVYPAEPPVASRERLEAFLRDRLGDRAETSSRARHLREVPLPDRIPAYTGLLVAKNGDVWARPYHTGHDPVCWHVFAREDRRFARACVPASVRILDVGDDWIMGVERDAFDQESIVVYPLQKALG